ncbi:hypothetical protein [Sphingobium ummariense]|uniref:hypothetical protein n=1 Tax=Sphingobium ummariense TaxID=420994 RepID=UPI001267A1B1|nr:hypothetical protein [Sphingobium ummariense]
MRLVGSREAQTLTDLSADQIREWTGRQGLIQPDVPACGKGTQARFSWRTLLLLRLAGAIRSHLHVELEGHRAAFSSLQEQLRSHAFHARDRWLVMAAGLCSLERLNDVEFVGRGPALIVSLAPHLEIVSNGLRIVEPMAQLPLFPADGLR